MTGSQILDAMNQLDPDLISQALHKRRRRHPLCALAACLALIFCLTLRAEASTGSVSNLLAPLFGSAQSKLVGDLGIPIGASVTAEGYTLTVDAVIGEKNCFAAVYSLRREDGKPIAREGEMVGFNGWDTNPGSGNAGGTLSAGIPEPGSNVIHFTEQWDRHSALGNRYIKACFSDLRLQKADGTEVKLAQGPWALSFTLRYRSQSLRFPVADVAVRNEDGVEFRIQHIRISNLGIQINARIPNREASEVFPPVIQVQLRRKDGTLLPLLEGGSSSSYSDGEGPTSFQFIAMFHEPYPLEEIAAVMINGTEIPVP